MMPTTWPAIGPYNLTCQSFRRVDPWTTPIIKSLFDSPGEVQNGAPIKSPNHTQSPNLIGDFIMIL